MCVTHTRAPRGAPRRAPQAQGNAAFSAGNYAEAVNHFTAAIALDAANHVLYSNRSAALVRIPALARRASATSLLLVCGGGGGPACSSPFSTHTLTHRHMRSTFFCLLRASHSVAAAAAAHVRRRRCLGSARRSRMRRRRAGRPALAPLRATPIPSARSTSRGRRRRLFPGARASLARAASRRPCS